jgi:hypothetical protein
VIVVRGSAVLRDDKFLNFISLGRFFGGLGHNKPS